MVDLLHLSYLSVRAILWIQVTLVRIKDILSHVVFLSQRNLHLSIADCKAHHSTVNLSNEIVFAFYFYSGNPPCS